MDICGDNRFEIIARAKEHLLDATNIETDEAEMAVLDNILFRCWQMGWLDRYDRKTEPQTDCEKCKHFREEAEMYTHQCEFYFKECKFEPKDESQTERREK